MKNSLLKGTLILTGSGIIARILGFFYRIYLSNILGTTWLGIYQLVFPLYGIAFTLYASGLQTSLSQSISGMQKDSKKRVISMRLIHIALLCSFVLALLLSSFVLVFAGQIAKFMGATQLIVPLRILSAVFPVCSLSAMMNGVFFGIKNAKAPAMAQLIEQVARIIFVVVVVTLFSSTRQVICQWAVWGLVAGELAGCTYNLNQFRKLRFSKNVVIKNSRESSGRKMLGMAIPLSGTHVIVSILTSFESVLIPIALVSYGLTKDAALSQFGILTGMVLPFILFPGAITNSLAVLLLPEISSANGQMNMAKIRSTTEKTIEATMQLGLVSAIIFIMFGRDIGWIVYHNNQAGAYLQLLAVLCPFIYTTTTLASIINGLGKAVITFRNTTLGLGIRIVALIVFVPKFGFLCYLVGLLVSQIVITVLDGTYLYHYCPYNLKIFENFVKPAALLYLFGFLIQRIINCLVPYLTGETKGYYSLLALPIIILAAMWYKNISIKSVFQLLPHSKRT